MFIDIYIPKTLCMFRLRRKSSALNKGRQEIICGVKFIELISQSVFEQLTK